MAPRGIAFAPLLLVGLLTTPACTRIEADVAVTSPASTTTSSEVSTTGPPPPATPGEPPRTTTSLPTPTTTTTTVPRIRSVTAQPWVPFAVVGGVTLHHPTDRVELVGFHESAHDGAQQMTALPSTVSPVVLESRDRDTGPMGAADIVSDPAAHVRAPVTGTIKRGGTYTLYCKMTDSYVVIEPDDRPGWEVKVLHMQGLLVRKGDRVVAGESVMAERATQLPFESQVDEQRTGDPAWPHVHVEVVDPTVKDRPTPSAGCS